MSIASFFVSGIPVTQGSKKLIPSKGKRRARMVEDAGPKLKVWRDSIAWHARLVHGANPLPLDQPVAVTLDFRFRKPTKPSRSYPCAGGGQDIEKLVRAVHDALTGMIWTDDSQCVEVLARKSYGETEGVHIEVRRA